MPTELRAPIDTIMPWRLTRQMTDVELRALYAHLKTVPPQPYGNRYGAVRPRAWQASATGA